MDNVSSLTNKKESDELDETTFDKLAQVVANVEIFQSCERKIRTSSLNSLHPQGSKSGFKIERKEEPPQADNTISFKSHGNK